MSHLPGLLPCEIPGVAKALAVDGHRLKVCCIVFVAVGEQER